MSSYLTASSKVNTLAYISISAFAAVMTYALYLVYQKQREDQMMMKGEALIPDLDFGYQRL